VGLVSGYLLDTNALIKWFAKSDGYEILSSLLEYSENKLYTSIISVTEFFTGCGSDEKLLFKMIVENGDIEIIPFDKIEQAESAAELRKKMGLKTPDAIIAATSLDNELMLVTFDNDLIKKVTGVVKLYPF
jgi:toxin FitB